MQIAFVVLDIVCIEVYTDCIALVVGDIVPRPIQSSHILWKLRMFRVDGWRGACHGVMAVRSVRREV